MRRWNMACCSVAWLTVATVLRAGGVAVATSTGVAAAGGATTD